jgi:DNA-binding response OmpR family regulator
MAPPMVLVVDDQPEYARLISLSLTRAGFDARTARGGEEAIALASELHPDVVLLDIHMPGMDGFEVMSDLRRRWQVPIIMVTGQDSLEQRRSGLDRGADDYVTKPFAPAELAARVRAVLRRGQAGRHAPVVAVDSLPPVQPGARGRAGPAPQPRLSRPAGRMLELLSANPDKVLYHDELLAHAFGPEFRGDVALLQEQIRCMRRALGIPAGSEGPIRTVRGVGYVYDPHGRRPARRQRPLPPAGPVVRTRGRRRDRPDAPSVASKAGRPAAARSRRGAAV